MQTNDTYRRLGKEATQNHILHTFLVRLIFAAVIGLVSYLSPFLIGYVDYGSTMMFIHLTSQDNPDLEKDLLSGVREQPFKAPLLGFVVTLLISLWSLLFVIPGIVKAYSYSLSTYILIHEKEIDPVAAITKSRQLMDGKKMQLFLLDLSYIGWYVLSLFTFGILAIWVSAWHGAARTLFMKDVYQEQRSNL
jgi:uncharacterized membrane protein